MADWTSNADQLAQRYHARAAALIGAVRASLRKAALAVERAMVKRLSGSGAPWSYPVPVRTGFLRRSTFVQMPDSNLAVVGNSASYANAVHTGYVSEWAGRGKHRMRMKAEPRPFLDDAVKDVDPASIVRDGIVAALEMAV